MIPSCERRRRSKLIPPPGPDVKNEDLNDHDLTQMNPP